MFLRYTISKTNKQIKAIQSEQSQLLKVLKKNTLKAEIKNLYLKGFINRENYFKFLEVVNAL